MNTVRLGWREQACARAGVRHRHLFWWRRLVLQARVFVFAAHCLRPESYRPYKPETRMLSDPSRGPGRHRAQVTAGARAVRTRPFQAAPPRPIRAVGIRLRRQVQRQDVGRWTWQPPCWEDVCLRNGPSPRESGSHLSGGSPP